MGATLDAVSDAAVREVTDFLVELSVALHKHAMYPPGHPALGPVAESVTRQAARLIGERELVAFGVARHQLIIEGVATDPGHPVLRRLAEGLHRHRLGAVSLLRGLQSDEVARMLQALAVDPDGDGRPEAATLPHGPHIRLHPLTFDGLTIGADESGGEGASGASRSALLWVGLAQAAMAGDGIPDDDATSDPSRVADAIDRHHGAEAYDQIVVGYLLQIAGELRREAGPGAETLRRRTSRLIRALKPATLRRLVTMGGHTEQRNAFILDAAHGMAVDAVLEIVKAAAEAEGETISHGLVRMLRKLSAQAEAGSGEGTPADRALREQVQRLLNEWHLADPNPDAYRHMLASLATSVQRRQDTGATPDDLNAVRVVQMAIEVDSWGPQVDRAIATALKGGGASALAAMLEQAPDGGGEAVHRLRASLTQPHEVAAIASRVPLDEAALDALLPWMSVEGYAALLDVLASSQNRMTRRKLLDRLAKASVDLVDLAARRLDDTRWYVQRNMLLLLGRVGRIPEGFALTPWVHHADARVRVEAVRLLLELPGQREAGLRAAFKDVDPRVVRAGLAAVPAECPHRVVGLLGELTQATSMPDDVRLRAIQTLGRARDRLAFDALLSLVDGGRSLFGRRRLLPKTPAMLAALRTLWAAWSDDPDVQALRALAASSPDDDVREAVR